MRKLNFFSKLLNAVLSCNVLIFIEGRHYEIFSNKKCIFDSNSNKLLLSKVTRHLNIIIKLSLIILIIVRNIKIKWRKLFFKLPIPHFIQLVIFFNQLRQAQEGLNKFLSGHNTHLD